MKVDAVDIGGVFEKNFEVETTTSEKLLTLSCSVSKNIENYGSCTLKLYKNLWTSISKEQNEARLGITDSVLLYSFTSLFNISERNENIFQSLNSHLKIKIQRNRHSADIEYFGIEYLGN